MAEQQNTYNDNKLDVVKTQSRKYGQCAFDIYDSLNIGKIRLNMVNKAPESKEKGTRAEFYLDFGDFLVIANDILSDSFPTTFYDGASAPKRDEKGQIVKENNRTVFVPIAGKYIGHKGSQKRENGKTVMENGKPVYEARVLTIEYLKEQRVPYHVTIATGKGEALETGAVKMVGKAETTVGIYLTAFQLKKLMKISALKIEHRLNRIWTKEDSEQGKSSGSNSQSPSQTTSTSTEAPNEMPTESNAPSIEDPFAMV